MSNIKWGPEREFTGEQPCPDWVDVQIITNQDNLITYRASVVAWRDKLRYKLPAEYEALITAKEPTHEQMRAALAAKFKHIPDRLVPHDPVEKAYNNLPAIVEGQSAAWDALNESTRDKFRAIYKAGMEAAK